MKIKTISQLNKFSIKIANSLSNNDCLLLFGEIGVGKTTFARYLINNLQKKNNIITSHVLSPTFNIVYDYDVKSHKIMHYDLYRLKSEIEIKELGIFEDSQKTVKIIEWPELIKANIKNKLEINFFYSDKADARNIKISGIGKWKNFKIN
jgi:tRNA threonylcarbamoyladenosine biosynthesis protein TsaE